MSQEIVEPRSLGIVLEAAKMAAISFYHEGHNFKLQNLSEEGSQWSVALLDKAGRYPKMFISPGQDEASVPMSLAVRPEIVLRRYDETDRLGVRLGLVPRDPLGDEVFDQEVFVDDIGRTKVSDAIFSKVAARAAARRLVEKFAEVRIWGDEHPLVLKQSMFRGLDFTDEILRECLADMVILARHLPLVEVKAPEMKVRSRSARWLRFCGWSLAVMLVGAFLAHYYYTTFGNVHLYEGAVYGLLGLIVLVPLSIWRVYGSGDAMEDLFFSVLCGLLALPLAGIVLGTAVNLATATTFTVPVEVVEAHSELDQESYRTTCFMTLDPGEVAPVSEFVIDCDSFENTPLGTYPMLLSRGVMGWVYLE